MKRIYITLLSFCSLGICFGLAFQAAASSETDRTGEINLVSPNVVISQFQTAGTSANDEFVELHNNSSNSVDLKGFRLVYRSAGGTTDVPFVEWTNNTIIAPGGYYLIASTGYDGGTAPDITYNPTTCSCSIGAAGGGFAVRNGALNTGTIYDSVGYGTATNAFIEGASSVAPPTNGSQARKENGCQDTDSNVNDFSIVNPSAPRNSFNSPNVCGGNPETLLLAVGSANPNTTTPGSTTFLTVTVQPATVPPSTGIAVTGNLTGIGGSANQKFFDDGTNGDATASDNVFSYLATVPLGTIGGNYTVVSTASDAQTRSVNVNINVTVNAPLEVDDHLLLGNPSNATTDVVNENNYLLIKPQYALSYNRSRATANWVSWRLDSTWIGSASRQDDFRPDAQLPAGWYQVTTTDYTGSGYDRGHMVPSGDRTRSVADNSATFLMTNIVPQLAANNQGAWEDFETYLRTLAQSGQEIYIVSGVQGNIGTIAGGRVVIPQYTWKVALVLPNGTNDLQRITKGTRTIGIITPNFAPLNINAVWRDFRVSVNEVENLTGYDFFSNVPKMTQELIERRKDRQ